MEILEVIPENKFVRHPGFYNAWLIRDEVTVGLLYCRYLEHAIPPKSHQHTGHDAGLSSRYFETRVGYRNQGVATKLIELVKLHFGVDKMEHSGAFTPMGYASISKKLTAPQWYEDTGEPEYRQMFFVSDWDKRSKRDDD